MLNIKFTTKKIGALVLTLGLGIAMTDGLHAAKREPVKRERGDESTVETTELRSGFLGRLVTAGCRFFRRGEQLQSSASVQQSDQQPVVTGEQLQSSVSVQQGDQQSIVTDEQSQSSVSVQQGDQQSIVTDEQSQSSASVQQSDLQSIVTVALSPEAVRSKSFEDRFNPDVFSEILSYLSYSSADRQRLAICSKLCTRWFRDRLEACVMGRNSSIPNRALSELLPELTDLHQLKLFCSPRLEYPTVKSGSIVQLEVDGSFGSYASSCICIEAPMLEVLVLRELVIDDRQLAEAVNGAQGLRELSLFDCRRVNNPYLLVPKLERLIVRGKTPIEPEVFKETFTSCSTSLKYFDYAITNDARTVVDVDTVVNDLSTSCPNLETFKLGSCLSVSSAKTFPVLHTLSLSSGQLAELAFFDKDHCPALRKLRLERIDLLDASKNLYLHPDIEVLYIYNMSSNAASKAASNSIEMIIDTALVQCPKIKEVAIAGSGFSINDGVIKKIQGFSDLKALKLHGTKVTPQTMREFVMRYPTIELSLGGNNSRLDSAFIEGNLRQRPGVKVITDWVWDDGFEKA